MTAPDDAPRTDAIARFIADTSEADLPAAVRARTLVAVRDTVAAMLAATHPDIPTGRLALGFAGRQAGCPECTVVGGGAKASAVTATMVNGTLAYAADLEPSTSAALQHCLATTLPAAIAMGERTGASGARVLAAVAVGVETECRVSWALGPAAQYALGFHPSSVCGSFGAAAAAASVLGLGAETVSRAMGLAACQASGLMAWETDPTENSRAFQCGAAARNGVTAGLLAARGFGGPSAVFDRGHTVFHAFSNAPEPERLVAGLGQDFDGVLGLKIKPYPCVAFLQPALDALLELMAEAGIGAADVKGLALRFARSGVHCVDNNPLRSHSAQYILAIASGGMEIADLFVDRRQQDPEVARLAAAITVDPDDGDLEAAFPARYGAGITLTLADGRRLERFNDVVRGSPEAPFSEADLVARFRRLVAPVRDDSQTDRLLGLIAELPSAEDASALVFRSRHFVPINPAYSPTPLP